MSRIILYNEKKDCCGCGACRCICPQNAITMVSDNQGFLFPEIEEAKCVGCGFCLKTCPIKKQEKLKFTEQQKPHIKIINYYYAKNYGAVIAAACLEDKVSEIVGEKAVVQTINYADMKFKKKLLKHWIEKVIDRGGFKTFFKNSIQNPNNIHLKNRRFQRFEDLFVNHTKPMDNNELENSKDNDVALICGSDIVWHTKNIIIYKAYAFGLNFGKENTKRIAYAPSIDCLSSETIMKRRKKYYRKNLSKIDCLSVREADSIKYLENVLDKKVEQCCDPVLFYQKDYFDKMAEYSKARQVNNEYVYAYILEENDYVVEYVKRLSKEKHLKICFYAPNYETCFSEESVNCGADGPAEFIDRVKNADYVVTTSYHCVIFSLIYRKQFLAFSRSRTSIKIPDLLNTLRIEDRLVLKNEKKDIDKAIDYDTIHSEIIKFREKSLKYLEESLKGIITE